MTTTNFSMDQPALNGGPSTVETSAVTVADPRPSPPSFARTPSSDIGPDEHPPHPLRQVSGGRKSPPGMPNGGGLILPAFAWLFTDISDQDIDSNNSMYV